MQLNTKNGSLLDTRVNCSVVLERIDCPNNRKSSESASSEVDLNNSSANSPVSSYSSRLNNQEEIKKDHVSYQIIHTDIVLINFGIYLTLFKIFMVYCLIFHFN